MKKSTLLRTAIILLFLLNAGTLLLLLTRTHQGPPEQREGNRRFDESVIHTLQLSPEQVSRFNGMKQQHHQQMMQLDEDTRQPFDQYFGMLIRGGNTVTKDSLERIIADLYLKRLQITYHHFEELKAICTPEQQQKFDRLVPSLMQVMSTGEKNFRHTEGKYDR